jgi:hypothetical protein
MRIAFHELLAYLEGIDDSDSNIPVGLAVTGVNPADGKRRMFACHLTEDYIIMCNNSLILGCSRESNLPPCTARRLREWMEWMIFREAISCTDHARQMGSAPTDGIRNSQVNVCAHSADKLIGIRQGVRYYDILTADLTSYSVVEFSMPSGNQRELCLIGDQDAT